MAFLRLNDINSFANESHLLIYIHHPGQFLRNGFKPILYRRKIHSKKNMIELDVQSLSLHRNREDSKKKCNLESSEDDKDILLKTIKKFNCTSPFLDKYLHDKIYHIL